MIYLFLSIWLSFALACNLQIKLIARTYFILTRQLKLQCYRKSLFNCLFQCADKFFTLSFRFQIFSFIFSIRNRLAEMFIICYFIQTLALANELTVNTRKIIVKPILTLGQHRTARLYLAN